MVIRRHGIRKLAFAATCLIGTMLVGCKNDFETGGCRTGMEKCEDLDGRIQCADLMDNTDHCGACQNRCRTGTQCVEGACVGCKEDELQCYCKISDDTGAIVCIDQAEDGDGFKLQCFKSIACGQMSCSNVGSDCDDGLVCSQTSASYTCGCPGNSVMVDGKCVSPNANATCGAKGDAAPGIACDTETMICAGGTCDCLPGAIFCDGDCIDPLTDSSHCGACGQTCGANASCISGQCRCDEGHARCGGDACVSSMSDRRFCGARGECTSAKTDDVDYQGQSCAEDQQCFNECLCKGILCDGRCVNTDTDTILCGATKCDGTGGQDCSQYGYGTSCSGRTCVCPSGSVFRTISGVRRCYNTEIDPECCGDSCTQCDAPLVCMNGSCRSVTECTGQPCKGWCVTDGSVSDITGVWGGECGCTSAFCDMDGNPNNGCEAEIRTFSYTGSGNNTVFNCGQCGKHCEAPFNRCERRGNDFFCVCTEGKTECTYDDSKTCQELSLLNMTDCEVCKDGWANDDGDWSNGCETNLSASASSCWKAGDTTDCLEAVNNAAGIRCVSGQCDFAVCDAGYGNCDDNAANGCETRLNSADHCGHCSIACKNDQACLGAEGKMLRCCFNDGKGCTGTEDKSCGLQAFECCDGLTLWREQTLWFGTVCAGPRKDSYICAKDKPAKPTPCWTEVP